MKRYKNNNNSNRAVNKIEQNVHRTSPNAHHTYKMYIQNVHKKCAYNLPIIGG